MAVLTILIATALAWAPGSTHAPSFSHKLHLENVGLTCTDCHQAALDKGSSANSLFPSSETCFACHGPEQQDDCQICAAVERLQGLEKPIPGIIFDHGTHLTSARFREQLGPSAQGDQADPEFTKELCLSCHHGMDQVALGTAENFPTMSECLGCHPFQGDPMASCRTCHSTAFNLRPPSHRTKTFFDAHSRTEPPLDRSECHTCHSPEYNPCTQCH
jgi:hypothetical protein